METDRRIVDISDYWINIIRDTAEFKQIAAAENPEFNDLLGCIYRIVADAFIKESTEYGVSKWESILNLPVDEGLTLDERKAKILTYLSVNRPYTWRILKQMLVQILGGEDEFVMEYINDEGKLVLHTDRLSDEQLTIVNDLLARVLPQNIVVDKYNHNIEISWRDINKYAACTNVEEIRAINPDFKNDLTSDKEWCYPLTGLVSGSLAYGSQDGFCDTPVVSATYYCPNMTTASFLFWNCRKLKKVHFYAPKLTRAANIFRWCYALEEVTGDLSSLDYSWDHFLGGCNLKKWTIPLPKLTTATSFFNGNEQLSEIEVEFPSLLNAPTFTGGCILNKASVLRICNSIPAYTSGTHEITLGIHIDHQNDADVLAAIDNATAKGWTVTAQWNGTATSGIALLDLEEIYVKVLESEYGEYTDENGNRCTLDWGHIITSPEGKTPEELGYTPYLSLDEAKSELGLTEYIEEELENE